MGSFLVASVDFGLGTMTIYLSGYSVLGWFRLFEIPLRRVRVWRTNSGRFDWCVAFLHLDFGEVTSCQDLGTCPGIHVGRRRTKCFQILDLPNSKVLHWRVRTPSRRLQAQVLECCCQSPPDLSLIRSNTTAVSILHKSHNHTTRILVLRLLVETFTHRAQIIALLHQNIQLLSSLQNILNCLM